MSDKSPDKSPSGADDSHLDADDSAEEFATLHGDDHTPISDGEEFATMQIPGDSPDESKEPAETVELHSRDQSSFLANDSERLEGTASDLDGSQSDGPDDDDVGGVTMVSVTADDETPEPEATAADFTLSAADPSATAPSTFGALSDDLGDAGATIMGSDLDGVAPRDDAFDTAQMTYVPDFESEDDELMKTQRVDSVVLDKIVKGEIDASGDDFDASAQTFSPSHAPTEATISGSMGSGWTGKSQWDLRIHKCDVRGTLVGISNQVPSRMEDAVGLQTALVDDKMVSDFEIVEELGAGNMGVVYRARQTSLNRDLAIKTLKPKKGSGSRSSLDSQQRDYEQEMFVSEAVVTANLVHPNIVPIHDLARTADGKLFYAMKEVTGTPWNKTIRKPGSLEDKLDILMKVCDGVAYAHSKGVINRDLKPENVVVGAFGEVMVLDWGLALTTDRFKKRGSVLTDVRGGAGTPVYMPPEQFDRDTRNVGYHSDIYLLGAMLFEILEGFPPHYLRRLWNADKGTNKFNAIVMAVVNNEIETDVTECELMNIARKAMATNPADRYQTVEEFQTAIREYRITGRAEELLAELKSEEPSDYSKHQAAVALFDEAHAKWPDNSRAATGGQQARLAYASLAVEKSDLDLASQVVGAEQGEDFDLLRKRIAAARRREKIQKVALAVFFFATIGFGAFSYITKQDLIAKDKRLQNVDQEIAAAETQRAKAIADADAALEEARIAEAEATRAQAAAKLAMDEADKAKQDAVLAEANAKKATELAKIAEADAIKANEEAAKASKEAVKAKEETRVAAAEAKKSQMDAAKALQEAKVANDSATKAKMELVTAEKAVEKATADAKVAQKEAMVAKAEAVKVKQDAEVAVKKLEEQGEVLTAQIAVAKKEQEALQADVYKSEYLVHKRYIDAYTELGEYGSAVRQIEKALADKDNVEIQKRASNLKRWQEELRRREGSQEVTLSRPVEAGAISPTGSAVATYDVDSDGLATLTIRSGEEQTQLLKPANDLIEFAFSPDGSKLAAVGEASQQLWTKTAEGWTEQAINFAEGNSPVSWLKPVFTADGKHMLLVGSDEQGTIDVFSPSADSASQIARLSLAGTTGADYSLHDLAVDPNGTFLIASTRRQSCRAFPLEWTGRSVALTKSGPNAAAIRLPIQPEIVRLAPNGEYLALAEGRELLILPAVEPGPGRKFPFARPGEAGVTTIETRIAIADLAFSADSSRLAAGLREKFIQLWDRQGDRFVAGGTAGLFKGQFLAGHSGGIDAVAFDRNDNDRLLSVGTDNSIRQWKISEYEDFVSHFADLPELLDEPAEKTTAVPPAQETYFVALDSQPSGEAQTQPTDQLSGRENDSATDEFHFRQGRTAYSSRLSKDGQRVIVGADDRAAHVFDTATGRGTMESSSPPAGSDTARGEGRVSLFFDPFRNAFLEGHIPQLSSVQFLPPNGDLLLTEDYFGSISVWDATADASGIGFEISRLLSEYSLSEFAVSDDGQMVIAGGAVVQPATESEKAGLRHFGLVWKLDDILSSPTPKAFAKLDGEHPREAITAVAISPNKTRAVTAGRRGRIVLWNLTDGSVVARAPYSHGSDQVSGVTFLTDDTLLTTGYDGRIFTWSVDGEQLVSAERRPELEAGSRIDFIIRMRPNHSRTQFVTSAVYSKSDPETRRRVSSLVVNVWNEDSNTPTVLVREPLPALDQSKAFRHDLTWSSDGSQLLYCLDGKFSVFNSGDWTVAKSFSDGSLGATRVAFAPAVDGQGSRVASFDGEVTHLWDIGSGQHLAEFRSQASVYAADFSADRKYVVTGSDSIRVFHSDESSKLHGQTVMRLHTEVPSPVMDVAFSPLDGNYRLATVDRLGITSIWDWTPNQAAPTSPTFALGKEAASASIDTTAGTAVRWSPDGQFVAVCGLGSPRVWNLEGANVSDGTDDLEVRLAWPEGVTSFTANDVAWTDNGQSLVSVGIGRIGQSRESVAMGMIWKLSASGDEGSSVSASTVGWFTGQHEVDSQTATAETGMTAVAVQATGDLLTGGDRGEIVRWGVIDDSDGSLIVEPFGQLTLSDGSRPHEGAVMSISSSVDGTLTSSGLNGWVNIWPAR